MIGKVRFCSGKVRSKVVLPQISVVLRISFNKMLERCKCQTTFTIIYGKMRENLESPTTCQVALKVRAGGPHAPAYTTLSI